MIGGKSAGRTRPTALGTLLQAATYGMTIPTIYGTTQSAPLVIWAQNLRIGTCLGKKGKAASGKKKKTPPQFVENIDFLIGSNPITGVLQIWNNTTKWGLNFLKHDFVTPFGDPRTLTIPDAKFYALIAVTVDINNTGVFADYGSAAFQNGEIGNYAIYAQGTGYAVNDTFTVNTPGTAIAHVTAITTAGAVTAIAFDNTGSGYSTGVHATTHTSGSGTGLQLNILSLGVLYNDTSEYALFNLVQHGPDLVDASYAKYFPYVYKWAPSDGATFYLPFVPNGFFGPGWGIPNGTGTFHAYYAQLQHDLSSLASNCLTFEPELGDGSEYAGFTSQQIIYPMYAGAGSPDLDLGSSGAIPNLRFEVQGSFYRFQPRGDADFCDMIEDVMKSGALQVGSELGLIQRGVNLNDLPGAIQKMQAWSSASPHDTSQIFQGFQQPIAAGEIMYAFARWRPNGSGVNLTISDTAAQTWIPVYVTDHSGLWYAIASTDIAAGDNVAIIYSGGLGNTFDLEAACWVQDPGFNNINNTATTSGTAGASGQPHKISISITVTQPSWIVVATSVDVNGFTGAAPSPIPAHWTNLFPTLNAIIATLNGAYNDMLIAYRYVTAPGTYSFSMNVNNNAVWEMGAIAVNAAQPVPYPKALGNVLDLNTLNVVRAQCQANGLWGSLAMNSQQAASDWLKQMYQCADAAPVWSGFVLKSIARSEVSFVGNGVVYTSPTASGPVANLTESDLIGPPNGPLISIERMAQVDTPNIIQVQYFDRDSDYNPSLAGEPLSGPIANYGPRKQAPIMLPEIQSPLVARQTLAIDVRRRTLLRNMVKFTMMGKWAALEAMDLITVNDSTIGVKNLPVRLTSIKENDKFELECEAEPFIYGCNAPNILTATAAAPYVPTTGADPGQVNTPIIFEPVPRLISQQNQSQVWAVVSGSSVDYGGCVVMLSTDGGASYLSVGTINGNGITGYTVGDWPANVDPDTTNNLAVDLTESLGTLESYSTAQEDSFAFPCYVAPGLTCIPYELMSYGVAVLTATNKYTLQATGTGNRLRRSILGAPQLVNGVDHPDHSRFAFLNPSGVGIFKINADPIWQGKTLYFKFLAFNTFGSNGVSLADATAYAYTPTGCPTKFQNPNTNNYTITGGALTQPTPTTIHMAQATAQFPSNTANYNARTFTISAPSVPTTYYVTIADPTQQGDEGTQTNLTATCQTSNALVGVPGNVFIGAIVALPGGSGTVTAPGGSSPGGAISADIQINGT